MSQKTVIMYGADWCPDCVRAKTVLNKLNVEYKYVTEGDGRAQATELSGRRNIPCIRFPDGSVLSEPSNDMLIDKCVSLDLYSIPARFLWLAAANAARVEPSGAVNDPSDAPEDAFVRLAAEALDDDLDFDDAFERITSCKDAGAGAAPTAVHA
mmetsp:Transcript_25900/g.31439  ORF Transcript_25900/g.31439 Transcript_25900/m.31439 type:complete len:154 (-) Transcript_25900:237-698(-)|eukprot:CAMPEP_0197847604 /NCGR_PEP_ID=MMETSP1438-20131217/6558_1 /TAXON_ID=1461541 /ORGANISM="Pterosperma sp., Strain CCMP1384" /LENGTH=153 /DNA_ID=CAMNT_0043459571 /DNA_START=127 /DNA_END=588 /DNA_ORIENTATION=-